MRWYELVALATIGALFGGAYLLRYHPNLLGLGPTVEPVFHDTFYIQASRAFAHRAMEITAVIGGIFAVILATATAGLRALASGATTAVCAGLALSVWPQHFLGRQGMPRRYIDYPEAFELWNRLSNTGSLIALCGGCVLLVLFCVSLWRRFSAKPA